MEIFKFKNPRQNTIFEEGEVINNISEIMWIERYRDAGEFSITAPINTDVREKLPLGTFISHADSTDIMMVENHEIADDKGKVPDVVITGRSFETYLENRVVGGDGWYPGYVFENGWYILPATIWNQCVSLMNGAIGGIGYTRNQPNNYLPHVYPITNITGAGVSEQRPVKNGDIYSALLEILALDSLGLKVIRPGPSSPWGPTSLDTAFMVHKGVERTNEIIFSYDSGEIDSADYLWSIKSHKTAAVVMGKWVQQLVTGPEVGLDRRIMYVDGSPIDNVFSTSPSGADYNNIVAAFNTIGAQALARQKRIALAKADVSRHANHYRYRRDYDVGDLVTVAGNFDETARMRVIEFVEIEDSTGESGYPTLEKL